MNGRPTVILMKSSIGQHPRGRVPHAIRKSAMIKAVLPAWPFATHGTVGACYAPSPPIGTEAEVERLETLLVLLVDRLAILWARHLLARLVEDARFARAGFTEVGISGRGAAAEGALDTLAEGHFEWLTRSRRTRAFA